MTDQPQHFQVSVRIKPMLDGKLKKTKNDDDQSIVAVCNNTLFVKDIEYKFADKEKQYTFNEIIAEDMNNLDTFEHAIEPSLKYVLDGYNVAILTYGITGSGKTHTVFGNPQQLDDPGICSQSYLYMINRLTEMGVVFQIQMSFLEIYNENVRDLLHENSRNLILVEDSKGVYAQDLSLHNVVSHQHFEQMVQEGLLKRALAPTAYNQSSSRSHAVLQIHVLFKNESEYCPKLTIIDLAGSEKYSLDPQKKLDKTSQEGANINKSLLALGNCINILSSQTVEGNIAKQLKSQFVPYRDSKLTRLLKDSLGGNSRTILLACISQKPSSYEETINTLNYASRAFSIKKNITKNIKPSSQPDLVLQKQLNSFLCMILLKQLELLALPLVCQKCGSISKQEQFNVNLDQIDTTDILLQLSKRMSDVGTNRQDTIFSKKQQLKESIDNLILQLPKSDISQAHFNFEDKSRCLERVCSDLQSNIEEFYEIKISLSELDQILRDYNDSFEDNKEIQFRLLSALKVNLNQKDILKEILIKLGDDQRPQISEIELQMRQQQLEMLNLLQINQEQTLTIQKLQASLNTRTESLLNTNSEPQSQFSNEFNKTHIIENPFENNKLNNQSEDAFIIQRPSLNNEKSLDDYGAIIKDNLGKSSSQGSKSYSYQKGGQLRYQTIDDTPSKLMRSEKENLLTFQTAQGSQDAYFSIENIPDRIKENQRQPYVTRIQLTSPDNKLYESQENNQSSNQRYSSNVQNRQNQINFSVIKNLQPQKLYSSPTQVNKAHILHSKGTLSGTNPLASSQESGFFSESQKKFPEGSPQVQKTSRTLATKFGTFLSRPNYSSNMLILD